MARKNVMGKASALSTEYIIDSDSEGVAVADRSVRRSDTHENAGHSLKTCEEKNRASLHRPVAQTETLGPQDGEDDAANSYQSSADGGSYLEESLGGVNVQAVASPKKRKLASMANVASVTIPARPFRPPAGFQEVRAGALDLDAEVLETLSGDLTNKQVWHITAPAAIPMSSMKQFSARALSNGNPLFTHGKRQYGFSTGSQDEKHLLVPENARSSFGRLLSISRSYHLREIPPRPKPSSSDKEQSPATISFFAERQPSGKVPPQQPEILKMRYKPFGADNNPIPPPSPTSDVASEKIHIETSTPSASSRHRSERKKEKKSKKIRRHNLDEGDGGGDGGGNGDGPEDDSIPIDRPSTPTATPIESSMVADRTMLGELMNVGVVDQEKATSAKKKRKKKKSHEEPVS